MYIEYITPQRIADSNFTEYKGNVSDYRPTWLVRVSDWQKVHGEEATDGYHTLSYVWEQSGEMYPKEDGEYGLNDDGHHKITELEKEHRHISNLFRHRQKVPTTREVTYDGLLQRICKDFDITYLWYDKLCIDQENKEAKHKDIKEMHMVYSNAIFTLALIPEVNITNEEDFEKTDELLEYTHAKSVAMDQMSNSLWVGRSWTLEELMMTTHIVVVGRNTHFWSLANIKQDIIKENDSLSNHMLGYKHREVKSINQILAHAHFRTSTKEHDKILALANILEGVIDVKVNYKSDISVAMNSFYRQLAEHDLSIMCFGSILSPDGTPQHKTTMADYNLPSWTGVAGLHLKHPISKITFDDNGKEYYIDQNMQLRLTCRSFTIQPTKHENYDVLTDQNRAAMAAKKHLRHVYSLGSLDSEEAALDWSQYCLIAATGCLPTHYWKPAAFRTDYCSPLASLSLTEACDECTILSAIFSVAIPALRDYIPNGFSYDYFAPVAKKINDGSTYKIIGSIQLCHFQPKEPDIPSPQDFLNQFFNEFGKEAGEVCIC